VLVYISLLSKKEQYRGQEVIKREQRDKKISKKVLTNRRRFANILRVGSRKRPTEKRIGP